MQWHDVVLYTGNRRIGAIDFDVNLCLPISEASWLANEGTRESVEWFFECQVPELTGDQAHILLSSRDFARAAGSRLFKAYHPKIQQILFKALAALILADDEARQSAVRWSEAAFKRGSENPRPQGTPAWYKAEDFAAYILGTLEMDGWTPKATMAAFSARRT